MDNNNQNQQQTEPSKQAPQQVPAQKIKADPVQATLRTGNTALSFLSMINSLIATVKSILSNK